MKKEKTLDQVDGSKYLSIDEASKVLGVKPTAIRNYLYLGKLTTHKFKNTTLLDIREVNDWKARQK